MTKFQKELDFVLSISNECDALSMTRYRATDLQVETKPDSTPVTEADKAVEELIRTRINAEFPSDLIVGEEFGGDYANSSGRRWIVDPIDGT